MTGTPDLTALMTSWELALRAQNKSAATVRKYLTGVRFFIAWCQDNGHVPALDSRLATSWISELLANGAEANTAIARLQSLKRFSSWLYDENELPNDPMLPVRAPRQDVKVVAALTDEQLRALIKACVGKEFQDRRDEAIVRLMAETAIRAGELVNLAVADIDLVNGLAIIRRGKGGIGRTVPFGPVTATALDRWLRMRRRHVLAETPALWLGERGRGLHYSGLYKLLTARAEKAGLEGFNPHVLRNTAATRWLAAGGSEGGLMAVAGWKRPEMMHHYVRDSAAARAADESRKLRLGDI